FGARIVNQGQVFLGLRDAENFFDGGAAGLDLDPAIVAQRAHTAFDRALRDGRGWGSVHDQGAEGFGHNQQLVDALAALVTELPTLFTANPMPELGYANLVFRETRFV